MGKDYKNRNQQYKNRKPYNKDLRNQRSHRGGHVSKGERNDFQKRKWTAEPKINLKETQVGITEFITCGQGFTGVVKARFSDFHVNEIEQSGKVLQLDDLTVPQLPDDGLNMEELEAAKREIDEEITAELWTKIEALARAKQSDELAKQTIELEVSKMDKEKRTQIHKVLKKLYEGKLVSTTINSGEGDDEKKFIKIYKPMKERGENRQRWTFPGEYVHFLVHKENVDTSEVAATMAGRLGLRPSQVNYCGTKDKRAKTTQKFCIKRRTPSLIVASIKGTHNIHVGNFEFSQEVLKLGNLKGNRFRIALRHVCGDQSKIEATLLEIKERGFINYYGLQRFGNCASIPTYEIGIALLKCDYKLACELILKPRDNDVHFMRAIRETWWKNRNSAAAAAMFQNDKFIEKKLLDGLAQYGEKDYASALRKIPRNMLLLYPHAFQSLVFNLIASRRIKEFGLQLIPGDLVLRNKNEQEDNTTEIVELDEDEQKEQNESVENDDNKNEILKGDESIFKRKVKPLTVEDIASGQWSLFDVVLPLPGFDITFPSNEVGKWYEELLTEHGLSVEKLKHNVKTYAMAGAYRRLIIQPEQMSWEFKSYETPECTLITSDWETLKEMKVLKESGTEGKYKALLLDFCLPTSAYATMFLRELLKEDTSAASQAELEQAEIKKHLESSTVQADETEPTEKSVEKRKQDKNDDDVSEDNDIDSKKAKVCESKDKL